VLAGLVNGFWLRRARRAVVARGSDIVLRRTEPFLAGRPPRPVAGEIVVSLVGAGRFHLATCPLVSGKVVIAAAVDDEIALGRRPCGVCSP
jgi:hypothetical protein